MKKSNKEHKTEERRYYISSKAQNKAQPMVFQKQKKRKRNKSQEVVSAETEERSWVSTFSGVAVQTGGTANSLAFFSRFAQPNPSPSCVQSSRLIADPMVL